MPNLNKLWVKTTLSYRIREDSYLENLEYDLDELYFHQQMICSENESYVASPDEQYEEQ